jgi:hypothetical protein
MPSSSYVVSGMCKATGQNGPTMTISSSTAPTASAVALSMGDVTGYQNSTFNSISVYSA